MVHGNKGYLLQFRQELLFLCLIKAYFHFTSSSYKYTMTELSLRNQLFSEDKEMMKRFLLQATFPGKWQLRRKSPACLYEVWRESIGRSRNLSLSPLSHWQKFLVGSGKMTRRNAEEDGGIFQCAGSRSSDPRRACNSGPLDTKIKETEPSTFTALATFWSA